MRAYSFFAHSMEINQSFGATMELLVNKAAKPAFPLQPVWSGRPYHMYWMSLRHSWALFSYPLPKYWMTKLRSLTSVPVRPNPVLWKINF